MIIGRPFVNRALAGIIEKDRAMTCREKLHTVFCWFQHSNRSSDKTVRRQVMAKQVVYMAYSFFKRTAVHQKSAKIGPAQRNNKGWPNAMTCGISNADHSAAVLKSEPVVIVPACLFSSLVPASNIKPLNHRLLCRQKP